MAFTPVCVHPSQRRLHVSTRRTVGGGVRVTVRDNGRGIPMGFAGGAKLLAAFAETAADCAVLDLHMPDVSGFEAMERLPAQLPVIVIAGHNPPEAEERSRGGGRLSSQARRQRSSCQRHRDLSKLCTSSIAQPA